MVVCDDIMAFVDGELGDERAEAFRAHLTSCTRCRNHVVGEMELSARMSTIDEPSKTKP